MEGRNGGKQGWVFKAVTDGGKDGRMDGMEKVREKLCRKGRKEGRQCPNKHP